MITTSAWVDSIVTSIIYLLLSGRAGARKMGKITLIFDGFENRLLYTPKTMILILTICSK